MAGYVIDFTMLVVTNILGGPHAPDSVPTPNQMYWWGIHSTMTPWIYAITALLTTIVTSFLIATSYQQIAGTGNDDEPRNLPESPNVPLGD